MNIANPNVSDQKQEETLDLQAESPVIGPVDVSPIALLAHLKCSVSTLSEALQREQLENKDLREDWAAICADIAIKDAAVQAADSQLTMLNNQVAAYSFEVTAKEARIIELQALIASKDLQIEYMSDALDAAKTQLLMTAHPYIKQADEALKVMETAQAELCAKDKEIMELTAKVNNLEFKLDGAKREKCEKCE